MHFGNYDGKIIELKIEHNVNKLTSIEFELFKINYCHHELVPIFTKLITEGYSILNDQELATKGNDMELFHFLSAGPLAINSGPQKLFQNINEIKKDLIINKKFIPFPPRPTYEDTVHYIQLMQARAHEECSFNIIPSNTTCPGVRAIVTDLGFKLTDIFTEETFYLFKYRLNEISDALVNLFQLENILNKPKLNGSLKSIPVIQVYKLFKIHENLIT
ncbi:hypothetical protein RhiirC2_858005 [Rhizophagus irregularis]|uniref:Uncharacterized protein n=1 Tax=Rhizophagus irregularis TaxID=588596 RepID=A0A2N1M8J3_9GLOM|nr:hypothetical protein RhiirC2_858005 [Rhizophagus irregularis]